MSIVAENLSYIYMKGTPFDKEALKNVNLTINTGEFVGIIGHTGSGKSTLIQHFNGLLKPTSGRMVVNGIDTAGRELKQLRRQVGIVFQYPEHQLFEETVYKDIAFGLTKQGVDSKEIDKRVTDSLKAVGMDESLLDKSPFELSGGQKRRVAIAGVLAMDPGILVLDEPTAGLDPAGRDEIFGFIAKLHRESGKTIVLVSHSMEDIARLTRRVIVMNQGTVEMDGLVEEIFKYPDRLEEIGLSAPEIYYFMQKLMEAVPGINGNVFTVKEARDEILRYVRKGKT